MIIKMISKFFRTFHKVSGLLLSLLFLMWFLSGITMIWHSFPKASQEYRMMRQDPLTENLPSLEEILSVLPNDTQLSTITIQRRYGRPAATLGAKGLNVEYYLDSLAQVEAFSEGTREKIIAEWCTARVAKIDTLWKVDQWIPFERWKKEMPIYRYHFDDPQKHQMYMTSKDGRVIQFTDKDERFWAWLGAIPHWVYFTLLRQHQTAWTKFVIWSASIGCVMCLCGFFVAIPVWWKKRKNGLMHNPYKKRWHRWHYASGLIFGLFAITFAFSGVMSMTDLPQWLKKQKPKEGGRQERVTPGRRGMSGGKALPAGTYLLDYRKAIAGCAPVKAISFESWKDKPYYKVTCNGSVKLVDASDTSGIRTFVLTQQMVEADAVQRLPKNSSYSLELINEYDKDYFARKKERAPLPVYRVIADDYMNTRLYYNPNTLQVKQVNDDTRTRSFLYGGLHRLDIKFLTDRPALWHIVMLSLLTGGAFLSFTGVVLTIKYIKRQFNITDKTNKR